MLELAAWKIGGLFILASVILGVVPFYLIRKRWTQEVPKDSRELGAQVALRIGILYSVLLGMVFAEVQRTHSDIRQTIQKEAQALVGVLASLERIEGNKSAELQLLLKGYAEEVINVEWNALAENQLTITAGRMLTDVKLKALSLDTNSLESSALRQSTLDGLEELSRLHRSRMVASDVNVPYLFWWVVIFGYLLIVSLFMLFRPTLLNLALVSTFCAMTGIVLFFIYVMGHPFSGPARIPPAYFEIIIDRIQIKSL